MVVFVHRRASRPQRSVLTDDVLADLELAREAEILNVAVCLGRRQSKGCSAAVVRRESEGSV